jgi:hypothetical protein
MTEAGSYLAASASEDEGASWPGYLLAAEGYDFVRHVPLGPPVPWHVLEFRRE